MILIDFKIKEIMAVPIPINFREAEIGAALADRQRNKIKARAVPFTLDKEKIENWAS
jgi:hypothetical protein